MNNTGITGEDWVKTSNEITFSYQCTRQRNALLWCSQTIQIFSPPNPEKVMQSIENDN